MQTCTSCGRIMEPRASWASRGVVPKYCSAGCRRHKPTALDRELESTVLRLLGGRARGATICPSEAARSVAEDWRPLMERTRRAARRLVASGHVVITQKGRVVDPSTAKGPIRIRKVDP